MQKTRKNTPNKEYNIHHTVVSISYYEHSKGEGSSFTIRKCMVVCLLFPYTFYDYYISIFFNYINSNFSQFYLRLKFKSKQKLMKLRLQGEHLEIH
jgi:hypothetical protein